MNCKQGEMGMIVRAVHTENLGRIVDIVSFWGYDNGEPLWIIRSSGNPILRSPDHQYVMEVPCPDDWLRPIRPGNTDETMTTHREIKRTARNKRPTKVPAA